MAKDDANGTEDGEAAKPRDASLRVDTKTLSSEEQDFARMMGFAGDADTAPPSTPPARAAATPAPTASAPAAAKPALPPTEVEATAAEVEHDAADATAEVEGAAAAATSATTDADSDSDSDSETEEHAEVAEAPSTADDAVAAVGEDAANEPEDAAAPARVFEEIHPRAAALGRQSALLERADRVATLGGVDTIAARPSADASENARERAAAKAKDEAIWLERVRSRDTRIAELERAAASLKNELSEARLAKPVAPATAPPAPLASSELEKDVERLRGELEGLLQERDRLSDELAISNAARVQAQTRAERFEVALRAARGPEGPVPEGERDLRAEVVGLRRRLEESNAESRSLRERLDAGATDLAIARAQGDDRQQEIEQLKERIAGLELERSAQVERLGEALVRQRELLALVTRVQAENVELRSTQAALEETLEARDLEINAREEHLQVTRRGLVTRDQQLLDAEERLEQARHRHAVLEAELEQQTRVQTELEAKLARRDARIASLSTTLTRIEQAIGRGAPAPTTPDEPPAAASVAPKAVPESPAIAPAPTRTPASETPNAPTGAAAETAPTAAPLDASTVVAPSPPPLLAHWRDRQLRALFGEAAPASVEAFLAQQLVARHAMAGERAGVRILSLGGARVDSEIRLLEALGAQGIAPVAIHVHDRSVERASARRAEIEAAGLAESISVGSGSGAVLVDGEAVDALFVCDALQGWTAPGDALAEIGAALAPGGLVLFADRLAGGPVVLTPESSERLAELWQVLPESVTGLEALAHAPVAGDDGGSAAPGDEARRALLEAFAPVVTVGLGHIADLFVGPARGFALSQIPDAADALLASIEAIDESRSILESLPARHGIAVCVRHEEQAAESAPEHVGLAWPTGGSR